MITITLAQGADAQKLISELQATGITAVRRDNMLDVTHDDMAYIKTLCSTYMPQRSQADIDREARKASAITEARLATELKTLTPAQAVAYIDANVTNIASAKAVLKIMARMLIALRDETWPGIGDE